MKLHAGDVVMAEFFKDKIRPGVIVGNNAYEHITVMVCPMTSDLIDSPLRIRLTPDGNGLSVVSEIMAYRIQALPGSRIKALVGRVTPSQLQRLENVLIDVFGLEDACRRLST